MDGVGAVHLGRWLEARGLSREILQGLQGSSALLSVGGVCIAGSQAASLGGQGKEGLERGLEDRHTEALAQGQVRACI